MINCCKAEKRDTKKCRKMLKRILILEEGNVLARCARGFEVGGFIAQRKLWIFAEKRMLQDREEALPEEDGNQLWEYKAMHEENFFIIWL